MKFKKIDVPKKTKLMKNQKTLRLSLVKKLIIFLKNLHFIFRSKVHVEISSTNKNFKHDNNFNIAL